MALGKDINQPTVSARRKKRVTAKHGTGAKYLTEGMEGTGLMKKTGIVTWRSLSEVDDEERKLILDEYFQTGNLLSIARAHNIAYDSMKHLSRLEWFKEELRALHAQASVQLKIRLTKIMNTSLEGLEDRLKNGNSVWRDGELRQVPLSAMDLTTIVSTVFSKKKEIEDSDKGFGSDEARRLLSIAEALRSKVTVPQVIDVEANDVEDADVHLNDMSLNGLQGLNGKVE